MVDITVVSGSSTNYGSLRRRLNPENKLPFISDILLLKDRMIVKVSSVSWVRTCRSSTLLYSILPLVGASMQVPWYHHAVCSLQASWRLCALLP